MNQMRGCVSVENGEASLPSTSGYMQNAPMLVNVSFGSFRPTGNISFYFAFANGSCLKFLDVKSTDWTGGVITNMEAAFASCKTIEILDLSWMNVSGVSNFTRAFSDSFSLRHVEVSAWDVSAATSLALLFSGCCSLKDMDVSRWDVSSCQNFSAVFNQCNSLSNIDVSGWDTSAGTNFGSMFNYCSALEAVDISGFDLGNATTATALAGMFDNCAVLSSLIGRKKVASDGSINGSTAFWQKGPKVSLNLSSPTMLDHDSLMFLMYWVSDLTGSTAQTLTLGATNLAKLTAVEKAIATAKNWTLA